MHTYSHLLWTVAGGRWIAARTRVRTGALLAGSVAPDLPLLVLTLMFWAGQPDVGPGTDALFGAAYDTLFFHDPVWVVSHNMLHAPLVLAGLAGIGWAARRAGKGWGAALMWFAVGCAAHAAIDIAVHRDDGPLLLFPFDWETRFTSPVSYWQAAYHARWVAGIEHLVDLAVLAWLGTGLVRRIGRSRKRAGGSPTARG